MRVTKNIEDFIRKEVGLRIDHKYASDREEAGRQDVAFHEFILGCSLAAADAFNAYFEEHFKEVSDFVIDRRKEGIRFEYCDYVATLRDSNDTVHGWGYRKKREREEIVERIIVALELGGSKAELMLMLDEVGKKED